MNPNIYSCDRKVIDLNAKDMFCIESFTQLQNLSESKIDVEKQMLRDVELIPLDKISRNNAMYAGEAIINALNSPYIQEQIKRGTFFGELDHPDPHCSRERFLHVEKDNICHRLINPHPATSCIRSDVQFVQPKGYIPWDWITKGSNISFSIRILTPNYEERRDANGNSYVYKFGNQRLVTWDLISSLPGFKEASIVTDVDSYDASKESYDQDGNVHISWVKGRNKDEFKRLLESQESLPILEDIYGFSMKEVNDISYSKEGLITINLVKTPEYTKSIKIPTNVYKVNQVLMSGEN